MTDDPCPAFDREGAFYVADHGDLMHTTKTLYVALAEIDRQAQQIRELTTMPSTEKLSERDAEIRWQKECISHLTGKNHDQVARIAELEESNRYLGERWVGQASTIQDLISKCARAREALVEERAMVLNLQDWKIDGSGYKVYSGTNAKLEEARRQLTTEMPEIFKD